MAVFAKRYLRFPENKRFDNTVNSVRTVLWPVYVYRIIYPDFSDKPLNLFQEGILGLYRAGCKTSEEIAGLLALDSDLVKFISDTQLRPNGYLSDDYKITDEGKRVLNGEERRKGSLYSGNGGSEKKLKTGYAFWDAIGQQWLPRLTPRLHEVEPDKVNAKGFPIFSLNRGKGKPITPYHLQTHSPKPEMDADALLEAYRHYRLDIHHAKQLDTPVEQDQQLALQSIELISDEPEPAYLWVSLIKNNDGPESWSVTDPFHIRSHASWLRKPTYELAKRESGLARQLGGLLGKAQAEKQTAEEWLKSLEDEVRFEILAEYPYLAEHDDISRYIQAVLQHQKKIQEGIDDIGQRDALVTELQKLIESVLKWMLKSWRVDLRRLERNLGGQEPQKDLLQRVYSNIHPELPESVANELAKQSWWKVRQALQQRPQSAKALLCGVILSASENSNHPFKLSPHALDITRLLELLNTRNSAGHASGIEFSKEEVLELSNFAIQWFKNFKESF